ncbi:MAG: RcpC/CpaB family pilus assembly protein [Lachnospiraceae bacterium]|nr:RcpC/CpaB family pilus assembly protein [Lachnospiraceae bacterium]
MKNRTVIGIICMVLAVITTFAIAPMVNRLTSDTTTVIRLAGEVKQGAQITEDKIETAVVKTDSIPSGILNDKSAVVGKYASGNLYAGDYFTAGKLTSEANTADDVFASLDGSKVAVSITIDTFAAGLSGKLQNGDIISVIVTDKETGTTTIPGSLKYLKVITTTTAGGVDKDSVVKNDDGTYELPSTVTVLVNTEQAKLLAKYEDNSTMQTALVYRGDKETADKFIAKQDDYLKNGGTANE